MDSEDGAIFIKRVAHYVRTHEKGLAQALQLQRQKKQQPLRRAETMPANGPTSGLHAARHGGASLSSPTSSVFGSGLLPALGIGSTLPKPAVLSLTPHHLYYLLTRFEELNIAVGPMGVRLENISDSRPNYVSFLSSAQSRKRHHRSSDSISIRSVSSVRSVMSGVNSLWTTFGLKQTAEAREAKAKAALHADLKYLYSAFTKLPCLRLAPDPKAKLVEGFEEFPFDTAVPLLAFKNLSALEISDVDIRQFYGWDQLSERLRSLTVKRGSISDPAELIIAIVLDDADKRRRRSAKAQSSPIVVYQSGQGDASGSGQSHSAPPSPKTGTSLTSLSESAPSSQPMSRGPSSSSQRSLGRGNSPGRPRTSKQGSTMSNYQHRSSRMMRSGSGSSHSSAASTVHASNSSANLMAMGVLPASKWRFLKHLSLADNSLTSISQASMLPLADSLVSLDLSSNLLSHVPEALACLSGLRALNLSSNMLDSLHSLVRNPLPAITALNLRHNRLASLAGIERLLSLERIDLRDNQLTDPMEIARLTGLPNIREIYVSGNPFTKTHYHNYRLTIFNIFRQTPGYTEDVLIDGSGPGMVERRSLVDRIEEPPEVAVIKKPVESPVPVTNISAPKASPQLERPPAVNRNSQQGFPPSISPPPAYEKPLTPKKRKTPRRRIVELTPPSPAVTQQQPTSYFAPNAPPTPPQKLPRSQTTPIPRSPSPVDPISLSPPTRSSTSRQSSENHIQSPTTPNSPPRTFLSEDWETKGDEYRRRIEALRNEVGAGWLSVLSDDTWDNSAGFGQSPPGVPPRHVAGSLHRGLDAAAARIGP